MTQAELYSLVVKGALISGIVFFIISVLLFFRLNIRKVIGDLTGSSAKKGAKRSKADVKRRKEQEQEFAKRRQAIAKSNEAKLSEKLAKTEKIVQETTVLGSDATVVLEPTMDLKGQATERLEERGTELLSESAYKVAEDYGMVIEDEVTVVNTDVVL